MFDYLISFTLPHLQTRNSSYLANQRLIQSHNMFGSQLTDSQLAGSQARILKSLLIREHTFSEIILVHLNINSLIQNSPKFFQSSIKL